MFLNPMMLSVYNIWMRSPLVSCLVVLAAGLLFLLFVKCLHRAEQGHPRSLGREAVNIWSKDFTKGNIPYEDHLHGRIVENEEFCVYRELECTSLCVASV